MSVTRCYLEELLNVYGSFRKTFWEVITTYSDIICKVLYISKYKFTTVCKCLRVFYFTMVAIISGNFQETFRSLFYSEHLSQPDW